MARYIDADILVETIKFHAENTKCENEFANEIYALAHEHIIEVVGVQPTAYDVDAVVAELEEEREYSYADFEEYVNEKSPCLDAEYDDFFHRGLERAVVIVRKGGAE